MSSLIRYLTLKVITTVENAINMKNRIVDANSSGRVSRREVLGGVVSAAMFSAYRGIDDAEAQPYRPSPRAKGCFLEIIRPPDSISYVSDDAGPIQLQSAGGHWTKDDVMASLEFAAKSMSREMQIYISAPSSALTYIHLRWNAAIDSDVLLLSDAWERSYGDLEWRAIIPERVMPWYFATSDLRATHGYGVKTGASALCFWQLDSQGISLWLNLSNGGSGVRLGGRKLPAAAVVTREGSDGEDSISAVRRFCALLCDTPRLPAGPVYGSNDWDYAYGKNTQDQILRDVDLVAALAPSRGTRPYSVIDDGWQRKEAFPDMARLATEIRVRGVRPGLWVRPLIAPQGTKPALLLPENRFTKSEKGTLPLAYDPTIPESRELVLSKFTELVGWRYELIKHDFSTFDLLGRWGFEMGARPTLSGWRLYDQTKTNAEVIREFYAAIRQTVGNDVHILGCNTIGHLAAGLFESQRIGDDTSGLAWERTRRMGVNTLAFRLPQHRTFFHADPDIVPITRNLPWSFSRRWLELVAGSGTSLFVSMQQKEMGTEQRAAVKETFALAASGSPVAEPASWFYRTTPNNWRFYRNGIEERQGITKHFQWCGEDGVSPFGLSQ